MSEKVWFIYFNGEQTGPFSVETIVQKMEQKEVVRDAFLFRGGWKDWRPFGDCIEELGLLTPPPPPVPRAPAAAPVRPPRATIKGQIIVHNNGQMIIGAGVNISSTGIFVETKDQIFGVGEILRLTCRVDGFQKPFNAKAEVMRFNATSGAPSGYGLRFTKIEDAVKQQIETLVTGKGLDSKARGA